MLSFLLAILLYGNVASDRGRIGIHVNFARTTITKVYDFSPAADNGLQVGDKIISCDDVPGDTQIDKNGSGTIADLVINRQGKIMKFYITRCRWDEPHDQGKESNDDH